MIIIFFLKGFLSAPNAIQDMIVNLFSVVFFGYILSFVIEAYEVHPVLGVLPVALLFFGIGVGIYQYVKRCCTNDESSSKVLPERSQHAAAATSDTVQPSTSLATRRQSVVQGLAIARELHGTQPDDENYGTDQNLHSEQDKQDDLNLDNANCRTPAEPGLHEMSPQFESNTRLSAGPLLQMYEVSDDSEDEFSVRPAIAPQTRAEFIGRLDDPNSNNTSSNVKNGELGMSTGEFYPPPGVEVNNEVIDAAEQVRMEEYPPNWGEWSSDSDEDVVPATEYAGGSGIT